jgi:predicted nuclease of restriction endonuclease-like RecB superfamily
LRTQKRFTKGRARRVPLVMNATEQAFYDKCITPSLKSGTLVQAHFERLKFVLAPNTTYTPDFFLVDEKGNLIIVEVKGFWQGDARVKIKAAADMFKEFHWLSVEMTTKKIKKLEGYAQTDPKDFGWLFQSF